MRWENWQRDLPPFKEPWGHDGYIVGLRYRREQGKVWHITSVKGGTIHDYIVDDGRFHSVLETHWTFIPSTIFVTDDAEASPATEEKAAILAAISRWETAGDEGTSATVDG